MVLRYITRAGSRVGNSWACHVVEDTDEVLALSIPAGSPHMRWATNDQGERELRRVPWRRDVLRMMYPGEGYSIWLFWEPEPRTFTSYYVNMEEPFRRTSVGVDTNDHALDIVIKPDLSWAWKDEEELEALIRNGVYAEPFGRAVRAAGESALERLRGRRAPFGENREAWTPAPFWGIPGLREDWQTAPVVPWEGRFEAYL